MLAGKHGAGVDTGVESRLKWVRSFCDAGRTARLATSPQNSRANRTSSLSCRRRSKSFRWRHDLIMSCSWFSAL